MTDKDMCENSATEHRQQRFLCNWDMVIAITSHVHRPWGARGGGGAGGDMMVGRGGGDVVVDLGVIHLGRYSGKLPTPKG